MCREIEKMIEEARKEEQERMAKLVGILMEAGDYDAVKQVVSDLKLCDEYYERYGIQLICGKKRKGDHLIWAGKRKFTCPVSIQEAEKLSQENVWTGACHVFYLVLK